MAIKPSDPRLQLYLRGEAEPIWKKQSSSTSTVLYLLHRECWCSYESKSPEFGARPDHKGIIEGVVQYNPERLQNPGKLYAEVRAHYRLAPLDLNEFDSFKEEIIYSKRVMLCPNISQCVITNIRFPPDHLNDYSHKLRRLYHQLGGTCISNSDDRERCVSYNFPFKFDISSGPDSITLESVKSKSINGCPIPKTIYNDAVYGFHDDDYEILLEEQSDISLPRIRHPGEPKATPKFIRKIDIESKEERLFAKSVRRSPPKSGIYWTVRVYALHQNETQPNSKNIAEMTIRKMTYIPVDKILSLPPPNQISTDYSLVVLPWKSDGGLVTLIAKLDKVFYQMDEPIRVDIKVHNTSCRIIHKLTIEVVQSIKLKQIPLKRWRNIIYRKEITDDKSDNETPILPGTEKLRLQCYLHPWKSICNRKEFPVYREPGLIYCLNQQADYELAPQIWPAFSTVRTPNDPIIATKITDKIKLSPEEGYSYDGCPCNTTKTVEQLELVLVKYEVIVRAVMRPQDLPDSLSQDVLLEELKLGSGLLHTPRGKIIETEGPCVVLPMIFGSIKPANEPRIPVVEGDECGNDKGFILINKHNL